LDNSLITSFAGVAPPAWLLINKIQFAPVSEAQNTSISLPKKDGEIFVSKKRGARKIDIELSIVAPDRNLVMQQGDKFAEWIDYDEPQPIIFRDLPNRVYYAILDGSTDLEKVERFGQGTITLICHDPKGYGFPKEFVYEPTSTDPIIYNNQGTDAAYPNISMEFTKDLTDFAIATADDALIFGDFNLETDIATDLEPFYLNDTGASTNGWTNGSTVDGGVVVGDITSNGYSFQQANKDYGTGTSWHGGSKIKSLGKQLQDFEFEAEIGLISNSKEEIGRVECYLLDVNGEKLGKVAMKDYSLIGDFPMFDAWVGGFGGKGGTSIVESYGDYKGVWKQFRGIVRITRRGRTWGFYAAQINQQTWRHHTRMYKEFTDWKGVYDKKVAAVQIHIGALKTHKPVSSMYVSNIRMKELLTATGNQVDYVFKKGDKLEIDCKEMKIWKNGEEWYDELQAGSTFPKFKKGGNGISVSDANFTNGKLSFSERWK
jgi:predicted phage tail component-like protein